MIRTSSEVSKDEGEERLIATDDPIYTQQPWRFVNLFVFILASFVNSLPAHTFTTVLSIVSDLYEYPTLVVLMNTLMFSITHPVLAFVANWILDKFGLRIGCSLGMILLTIGVWLRVLINYHMAPVLIGSFLAAAGNIFIINSPSKIACSWFRPIISPRVTTFGVMANMASIGIGVILPSFFVGQHSNKDEVRNMLMYEAIFVTVPAIFLVALIRNKPKNPPSFAAGDIKSLFKNKNYLWLMLSVSMSYGSLTCFTSCIQSITGSFYQTGAEKISAYMLASALGAGFVSSVVFVILLKKSLAYKKILISAMVGTILQLVFLIFTFDLDRTWLILVVVAFAGFFFIPQIAIFLQLGCQLVFPIGQASSSGFLLAGGQLTGFLTGLLGTHFLEDNQPKVVYIVLGILIVLIGIGIVAMWLVKQDLRKINYQKHMSQMSVKSL